jgi:ribosomal-protein-alanine N-acetyltransferase
MTQSMDEIAVVIEPMRLEDLDEVVALDAAVSNPVWSRAMFESELTTNQFAGFLVARMPGGGLCGYIGFWIVFEELHLLNVVVHPDWRRQGIAARLVRAVFEIANAKDVIRALLEVRASNVAAQQLYARFGFQVIACRSGYYTQPSEEALIMACDGIGGGVTYQ